MEEYVVLAITAVLKTDGTERCGGQHFTLPPTHLRLILDERSLDKAKAESSNLSRCIKNVWLRPPGRCGRCHPNRNLRAFGFI